MSRTLHSILSNNTIPEMDSIGRAGAIEKLALENALREIGFENDEAKTITNLWASVVHIGCGYTDKEYELVAKALSEITDTEFRHNVCMKFLSNINWNYCDDGNTIDNDNTGVNIEDEDGEDGEDEDGEDDTNDY